MDNLLNVSRSSEADDARDGQELTFSSETLREKKVKSPKLGGKLN